MLYYVSCVTANTFRCRFCSKSEKDLESYIRRTAAKTTYFNKRELATTLPKMVRDGLIKSGFTEAKYEPIPFKFAETPKGKPFADSGNIDHLDAWVKYKANECQLALIVWGSRKASPIKEEYLQ